MPAASVDGFGGNRWPNFTASEFCCRHCGEYYHAPAMLDALQQVRSEVDHPIKINSAHRCRLHNARVGGAIFSQHLLMAFDIDLQGHDRAALKYAAKRAGFGGFGYYENFLHLDGAQPRQWFQNEKARQLWKI